MAWTRRNILKGVLHGSAVTVGLPLLDFFLDNNGMALASGAPIPVRYGTWFWGCGVNAARWFPTKLGRDYDIKEELKAITPYKDKVTVFSGMNCELAGKPNLPHWSAVASTLTGVVPSSGGVGGGRAEAATLDCLISDHVGKGTRFRSLEVACTGQPNVSYSMRAGSTVNPSEVDPVALYKRIFGPEFKDPNSAEFTPDPQVMLERSVLSSIKDERDDLMRTLGTADRQRVDQYFTSLRQIEEQLGQLLQKPAPAEACVVPKDAGGTQTGAEIGQAMKTHDMLAQLLAMALACNQTRVFNVALSSAGSDLRKPGDPVNFHELTHEEPVDEKLGYQPKSTFFMERSMETFASMLKIMDSVKEGDRTLLDNSLIMATSESNFAKVHSVDNLPIMVAGSAGGKWKTGQHVSGRGDPATRVGLTIQQVMGLPVSSWGKDSMETSKPVTEVLV
jgi:hypothetical protein